MQLGQNAAIPISGDLPPTQKSMVCDAGGAADPGSAFADFISRAETADVKGAVVDAEYALPRLEVELIGEEPRQSQDTTEADDFAFAWLLISTPVTPANKAVMTIPGSPTPTAETDEDPMISTEVAGLEGKTLLQSNSEISVRSAIHLDEARANDRDMGITLAGQASRVHAFAAEGQDAAGMWSVDARSRHLDQTQNSKPAQGAQFDSHRFQGIENAFGVLAARQAVGADKVAGPGLLGQQAPTEVLLNAAPGIAETIADPQGTQPILPDAPAAKDTVAFGSTTPKTEEPQRSGNRAESIAFLPKDLALAAAVALTGASAMTPGVAQTKAMDLNAKPLPEDTPQSAGLPEASLRNRLSIQQANAQPNMTATNSAKANLAKTTSMETELNVVKEVSIGFTSSLGAETPKLGVSAFVTSLDGARFNPSTVVAQIVHQLHQKPAGTVEINLHPKDLGKLHFEMIPKGEGMSVTLSAEQPQTMEILRKGADQLLQELRNAGFVGSTISFDQWGQRPQQQSNRGPPFDADSEGEGVSSQISAPQTAAAASSGRSLDIRL